MFPYIPNQPAYNKRLRGAQGLLRSVIRVLAEVSPSWFDDLWITDATPVPCGMSRETAKRSDLAAEQRRLRRGTARVPFAGLRSSAQTFGALRRPSTVCAAGRQPARIVGQSARRPRAPTTVPRTTTSGVSACVPVRTRSHRPSVALPVTMSAMTTATRTSRTRAAT